MNAEAVRWGDISDSEDDEVLAGVPRDQPFESEPDENGVKTVVSIKRDKEGRRVRHVRRVQLVDGERLVSKAVVRRREMRKFGQVSVRCGA